MEFRAVGGVNVMDLDDAKVAEAGKLIRVKGFKVGCVTSPIGKTKTTDPFEPDIPKLHKMAEFGRTLGTDFIRVFSWYIPKGEAPEKWRKETLDRIKKLTAAAEKERVTLILENEGELYGDTVERCIELIEAVNSPRLALVYDPGNLIVTGPKPFTESYPLARPHIRYFHVKDWSKARKAMVPAGEGDAEWPPILKDLAKTGWSGIIALEPHLEAAGKFSGFSGPDLFRKAHTALTGLMRAAGMEFR